MTKSKTAKETNSKLLNYINEAEARVKGEDRTEKQEVKFLEERLAGINSTLKNGELTLNNIFELNEFIEKARETPGTP